MFGDMMGKLGAMKEAMEASKARLDNISVKGEAENGLVVVTMNGNRKLLDVSIDDSIIGDKEALEDLVSLAITRALDNAENVNNAEMQGAARNFMPGM